MTALNPSPGADSGKESSRRGATRFSYRGHQLPDADIAGLPDHLICKDNASGDLTARRHTERFVPVPRKASE